MSNIKSAYHNVYVNIDDAGDCVVKLMSKDNTKQVLEKETDDFRRGALWGMSWAFLNIICTCKQYVFEEEQEDEASI